MSKPFLDLIFSTTSVSGNARSELAAKIKALGGTHLSNLTSDVNVLIVGNRNTDKYKFSVRSRWDIKFIKPETVVEIHSKWINNDDKDDPELLNIDNYLLDVFEGLNICISRIRDDDIILESQKSELVNFLEEHGAIVSNSLTISTSCLVTNEKSGRRYDMARNWEVATVHPKWIIDSLKRNAALDYKYYDISSIADTTLIGEDSCIVWNDLTRRKKRKIIAAVKEDQIRKNPKIWNSIMSFNKKHAPSDNDKHNNDWDEQLQETSERIGMPKNGSFIRRKDDQLSVKSYLFGNLRFFLMYFSEPQMLTLKKAITSHSGTVVDNLSDDASYILVPSFFDRSNIPNEFSNYGAKVATEWFIERSLHYKAVKYDAWGTPFYHYLHDLPKLNVCTTGFSGIELLHITKLIKLLGFNLHDSVTQDRDILFINIENLNIDQSSPLFRRIPSLFDIKDKSNITNINSTRNKIKFCKTKNIPILSVTYLFNTFQKKGIPNINNRDWCIYCPKLANINPSIKHLIEIESIDGSRPMKDERNKLTKEPKSAENGPKKISSGIVASVPLSQIDHQDIKSVSAKKLDSEENNDIVSTQISYGNNENNSRLLKLLNKNTKNKENSKEVSSELPHEPRKRTRANYKEMLDTFDENH